jgi:hypothetical protein
MAYRGDERVDLPVEDDTALQDPVVEDAGRLIGEEIDPDSVRPLPPMADEDELLLDEDDEEIRRGL